MNFLDNNSITIHSDVPYNLRQYLDSHPEMFALANAIIDRIRSTDGANDLNIEGMFFVPSDNSNNLMLSIACNNEVTVACIKITDDGKFKFRNNLLVDPVSFVSSEEGWNEILSSIHHDKHMKLRPISSNIGFMAANEDFDKYINLQQMSDKEQRFINNIPHFSTQHVHEGRANNWKKGIGRWLS